MNLQEHYTTLYKKAIEDLKINKYNIDDKIQDTTDNRFGITLLLRPSETIKNEIQSFLKVLKKDNPKQYYYNSSDIHITILSVISCYAGFDLNKIEIAKYSGIIQNCLNDFPKIEIEFKGITASNEGILIQGFPKSDTLETLRNTIRTAFKNSTLEHTIDQRYTIATAHATVMRYQNHIENSAALISILEKYRDHSFGKFTVNQIELVYNDWYQKEEKVLILHTFKPTL